jgi:hypothetical protein
MLPEQFFKIERKAAKIEQRTAVLKFNKKIYIAVFTRGMAGKSGFGMHRIVLQAQQSHLFLKREDGRYPAQAYHTGIERSIT